MYGSIDGGQPILYNSLACLVLREFLDYGGLGDWELLRTVFAVGIWKGIWGQGGFCLNWR